MQSGEQQTAHARQLAIAVEHHKQGRRPEAELLYHQILAQKDDSADALHLLGMLYHEMGHHGEALELIRRSLEIQPNQPHVLSNYGSILAKNGRAADAIQPLTTAIEIAPQFAAAHNNLGAALERLARWQEALVAFDRAIALNPAYVEAHTHRGNVLRWFGHIDEAITAYETALRIRPNHAPAISGLGSAHGEARNVEGIIACHRAVIEAWPPPHPSAAIAHSDLLYTLHYDPEISPETLFAEHQRWAKLHAEALYPDLSSRNSFDNDHNPNRRLRIGYVSADFRSHPVAYFLYGALEHADREHFELFAYSDVKTVDRVTSRCKAAFEHWTDTSRFTDVQLAQRIREDRIDILVDQTGHAGGNRMLVFARKPAPIQLTFNGYVDTTGLHTMDYRWTDMYHDPPNSNQQSYTEQLLYLPQGQWCYAPDVEGESFPEVDVPPVLRNGFITFGSFNKPIKMNRSVLELWARLLREVPTARLMIAITGGPENNRSVRERVVSAGIPGNRLDLVAKTHTRREYLERYRQIDIALDTFPFNGMTTTCDALLMGVPVIALAGSSYVSRSIVSFLTMANLPELIANSSDKYINLAGSLANNRKRLVDYRMTLRDQLLNSELCNKKHFAHKLEQAFFAMWRTWCER